MIPHLLEPFPFFISWLPAHPVSIHDACFFVCLFVLKQTMWTMAVAVVNLLLEQTTADQSQLSAWKLEASSVPCGLSAGFLPRLRLPSLPNSLPPFGRPRRSRGVVGRSPAQVEIPSPTPWSRGRSSSQPGKAAGEEATPSRRAEELEPGGDGRRTAHLDRWRRRLQLFPPFPIVETERGPKPEWRSRDLP